MHCPNCGQKILEGSDFCSNCGNPVVRQLVGPTCAKCGSRNLPEAEFCAECGARLGGESVPMQSFCPECGAAVKESATFCKMCGAKLKEATVPVQSVCPGCGEALPPDAVFCGNCGMSLEQGGAYASGPATVESDPSYQTQEQEYVQQQAQYQQQAQTQDWEYPQQQQAQPQDQEYPRQEEPYQHQAQPQFQNRESVDSQPQTQLPQKSSRNKMLMAAAAAVVLLVVGITGFWKPGFLLDMFRPTAKLENGTLALKDITLDFKQTNLANGKATLTTVKDKEVEVQNGLIGDLYVMKVDKSCQGKVTVAVPAPKDFKPTTGNGLYIKLGIGRDYALADGKTERRYSYFDTEIKDGKVVAVIDPAVLGQSVRIGKASSAKAMEIKQPDLGEFTEYVGYFFKHGIPMYGEGYQNSKGHFRVWYNYNINPFNFDSKRNVYMAGDDAKKLLSDLEEAYNYYKTHGYAEHVDTFTPIDVYITRCSDEGGWNALTGNIELKESSMFGREYNLRYEGDQRIKTKTTIYHEFFHAVQQSMLGTLTNALSLMKSNWFGEATATHFERLIVPDEVTENGKKLFWRLWQGPIPDGNGTDDGYARGLLIDYMSSKLGGDDWIKECYRNWVGNTRVTYFMKKIAPTEADFAEKFYMEVIRNRKLVPVLDPSSYHNKSRNPNEAEGEDRYISSIRLQLDDKTKEKIEKGEEDASPVVFTSPSFEVAGYGGRVVGLITKDIINKKPVNLTKDFPNKSQLKLEAEGGCRIQIIRFTTGEDNIIKGNIIKNFREQIDKGYKFLVLVTSTKPKKQNVVLKATLEKEELKEGIYNGKTTATRGKETQTRTNVVGFRLSQGKDGKWSLNICQANGDYGAAAANVPLTYDAKQKIWKGRRKFKQELSKDPQKSKPETSTINCTMKVNTEGNEPVIIVDYNIDVYRPWEFYSLRDYGSMKVHFEGKWSGELKGKNLSAKEQAAGKFTILE